MAHTVLYYHIIWRTKRSKLAISEENERILYAYIHGFCKNKRCTLIRIGGMPDHIHMFVALRPDIALSSFMQVLKTETSKWMSANHALFPRFNGWGVGYAAFTYCERDKEMIINYIKNKRHITRKRAFKRNITNCLKTGTLIQRRIPYSTTLTDIGSPAHPRFARIYRAIQIASYRR